MKQMMTSKCRRFLKRFMLTLMLVAFGMNAGAQTVTYSYVGSAEIDGVRYSLYVCETVYWPGAPENIFHTYYASVSGLPGTQEEIVIPRVISYEDEAYLVNDLHYNLGSNIQYSSISNNSVRVLRFKGATDFHPATNYPTFNCPNLTDIYFEGATPTLTESYAANFKAPGTKTITVHVSDKTKAEIEELKAQPVWSDFLNIVGRYPTRLMLTTNAANKEVEVWKDDGQVCSIPQKGGTVWNDIGKTEFVQFRIPNQYLENIIINGEDVTATLPSTTPTDPAYEGYTFYTLNDYTDFTVVEVKFNYHAPETIHFADAEVKRICVENWDADHDGELSVEEAAQVTTLKKKNTDGTYGDPVFKQNHDITSFNELQYFTKLKTIEEEAFYYCTSLTSIMLPPSIEKILGWGFCHCTALESISLPNALETIGQNAFNSTGLKTLFIPKNVKSINIGITGNCTALESIVVDAENEHFNSPNGCNAIIHEDADNNSIQLVAGCKNTVIPDGVTSISSTCFYYNSQLKSIEFPKTLTTIGASAFYYCTALNKIVSKATTPPVKGSSAFTGISSSCTLTVPAGTRQTYIDAGWTEEIFTGGIVEESKIIEFADAKVKAICVANWDTDGDGELSMAEAAQVTTLKKKNADGTYGDPVFKDNHDITSFNELQYFTKLKTIEDNAFYYCTSLTSIMLPPSIEKILGWGFCHCTALESISLPNALETIGQNAFNSTGLKTLFIPKNVKSINIGITGNCTALESIVVDAENEHFNSPNGCNAIIHEDADNNSIQLVAGCKNTVIPDGVTSILSTCFYYNSQLKSIEFPQTLTTIGSSTFYYCTALNKIVSKATTPPDIGISAFTKIPSTCTLTVPAGTRQTYIDAGWTTKEPDENGNTNSNGIFNKIVEDVSQYDVNGDNSIDVIDVTKLVDKILH